MKEFWNLYFPLKINSKISPARFIRYSHENPLLYYLRCNPRDTRRNVHLTEIEVVPLFFQQILHLLCDSPDRQDNRVPSGRSRDFEYIRWNWHWPGARREKKIAGRAEERGEVKSPRYRALKFFRMNWGCAAKEYWQSLKLSWNLQTYHQPSLAARRPQCYAKM